MMKLSKKKTFVTALIVCLIAILSLSTLAWFTDDDDVTNKFQVATSDSSSDPDDIFSIDVKERVDTDGDGRPDMTLDDGVVDGGGYTYKNILPGDTLYKEPIVKNTGAYDQWVRVKVTVDNANEWVAILTKHGITELDKLFTGHDETLWKRYDEYTVDGNTLTYTYYLNEKLVPDAERTLFTGVVIPQQLDRYDAAMFAGGTFSLTVVAEAIQAEHTGTDAHSAFTDNWGK